MDNDTESFELGENPNFMYSSSIKNKKASTRTRIAAVIVVAIALLFSVTVIGLIAQLSNELEADREENARLKSELESQINKTRIDMVEMMNTHAENAKLIAKPESKVNETRIAMKVMKDVLAENAKLKTELESKINQTRLDMDRTLEGVRDVLLKADGWLSATNEVFYKKFYTKLNYNDSIAECERHGAHLLSEALRRPKEIRNMVRQSLLPRYGSEDIWIGYTDIEVEDEWVWVDGKPTNEATLQWIPGQPDNWKTGEHCGEFKRMKGNVVLVNDVFCDDKPYVFICEKVF